MTEYREYYHRHLPHWQPQHATFFVTFRLKNSMPANIIEALRAKSEREKFNTIGTPENKQEKRDYLDEHNSFVRWDSFLDKAEFGPRWLTTPEIAGIVAEALHYRNDREYDLHAFCIMSNHVHTVFAPLERRSGWHPDRSDYQSDLQGYRPLYKIMQSLKRHTARQANILLGRQGSFWQDESYDHVIRNNEEYLSVIHYTLENPVTAGFVSKWEDWPWAYCKSDRHSDLQKEQT